MPFAANSRTMILGFPDSLAHFKRILRLALDRDPREVLLVQSFIPCLSPWTLSFVGLVVFSGQRNFDKRQKPSPEIWLINITLSTGAQSYPCYLRRIFLAEDHYFGTGGELSYLPGDLESIQFGEPNIQHNQVGLQQLRFLDCF